MDNKVWSYFFCFVEQSAQWKEKGFLVTCKDKAKIQLIGWVTQKVNSIGMILCNALRTMSILQKDRRKERDAVACSFCSDDVRWYKLV